MCNVFHFKPFFKVSSGYSFPYWEKQAFPSGKRIGTVGLPVTPLLQHTRIKIGKKDNSNQKQELFFHIYWNPAKVFGRSWTITGLSEALPTHCIPRGKDKKKGSTALETSKATLKQLITTKGRSSNSTMRTTCWVTATTSLVVSISSKPSARI